MRLTAKEEKIARLALDKGAQPGERDAAAIKLINSLHARGVTVEDIEKVIVREKVIKLKVAMPSPPPPPPIVSFAVARTDCSSRPVGDSKRDTFQAAPERLASIRARGFRCRGPRPAI
jgi:hypothetical protein